MSEDTSCGTETPPRFETALSGLEQAVRKLEGGDLPLDDALACYEQGLALVIQCRGLLTEAERKVALLTGVREDGVPETAPFDASATFQPEAAEKPRIAREPARPKVVAMPPPMPVDDDDDDAPF
jgi:exodeoxyribonuclease VII small subunit